MTLIGRIYQQGWNYPEDGGGKFQTTCGVKQGCPLSVLLFQLTFNLLVEAIQDMEPTAFADNVGFVAVRCRKNTNGIASSRGRGEEIEPATEPPKDTNTDVKQGTSEGNNAAGNGRSTAASGK